MEEQQENKVTKLPLWKTCAEQMLEEGIDYGKTYPYQFFEDRLKADRNSIQFSIAISKIRHALLRKGFYLSGVGAQKHGCFCIQQPNANKATMTRMAKIAQRSLARGVILGTNTPLEILQAGDRKKHEQILERLQLKYMFIRSPNRTARILGSKLKLLNAAGEKK